MSEREQVLEEIVRKQDILISGMQAVIDGAFEILNMLKPRLSPEEAAALENAIQANKQSGYSVAKATSQQPATQLQPILDAASKTTGETP